MFVIDSDAQKKDQLRLIHMPTASVYTNWPTEKTPFGHIECMSFSPGGEYLATGNSKGKVLLYRLNHFCST
jgi:U3 small nucleolar RNA-associated protein 18